MRLRVEKRTLSAGIIAGVIVAGSVVAVTGATPAAHRATAHRRTPIVAAAASYLGVSTAQIQQELRSGESLSDIANATAGKSAAGLVEVLVNERKAEIANSEAGLPARISAAVDRPGGPAAPGRRLIPASAAARYLGLSGNQLRADLRSGMTLASIARAAPGKSEAGLIEAILARRRHALAARLASGGITQAQESERLATLEASVKKEINRARLLKG
jgi:hypothetical protein